MTMIRCKVMIVLDHLIFQWMIFKIIYIKNLDGIIFMEHIQIILKIKKYLII